jgi:hypothetical protein
MVIETNIVMYCHDQGKGKTGARNPVQGGQAHAYGK